MHQFNITLATFTDIPAIQEIIAATWEPTYRAILSPGQIKYMQAEIYQTTALQTQMAAGQQFYILRENFAAAGFAAFSLQDGSTFKLHKLYVKPAYQGKGYGSLLIRQIEQEVWNRGGKYLILNVNRHNPAREKYEHLGFKVIKEEDIPIGPYWMNDFVMQKSLIPAAQSF